MTVQRSFWSLDPEFNPWQATTGHDGRHAVPRWDDLAASLRAVQDAFAASVPPEDVVAAASERLDEVAKLLAPYAAPLEERQAMRRLDLHARGQTLVPGVQVDRWDEESVDGRVTFRPFYLAIGTVHGGAIALLFDELLGRLTFIGPLARTAYLHVNYRSGTPIEQELTFSARISRREGRKIWITGEIRDGDTVCADAEALFLTAPGEEQGLDQS